MSEIHSSGVPSILKDEEKEPHKLTTSSEEDLGEKQCFTEESKDQTNSDVISIEIDSDDFSFVQGNVEHMDNSPYPEVREVVPNTDDPTIEINHWRTWFLTTIFVMIFSGVNQFFSLRYPSLSLNFLVAQVVSFPVGKFLAWVMPDIRFRYPWFNLNPGPYTIKEHGILTICVSLAGSNAYATNILIAQTNFYNKDFGAGYEILLIWTSQILGYGLAGLTRRFVVDPAFAIWPQTLISISLFETLHSGKTQKSVDGWNMSRYKFFSLAAIGSFVWYWFPGFIFKALGYFNFVLWGAKTRDNFVLNFIFGVTGGVGVIPVTFDYTQISQAMSGSVFATPFWVITNTYASVFIFFIVLLPILYFTNSFDAKYLPVISTSTFNRYQKKYDVTKILNEDFTISYEKYKEYSPLFIPFSYLLSYALNFAAVVAILVHCALYHGKDIYLKLKNSRHGGDDVHMRMYRKYNEVPDWWYGALFVIFLGLSFAVVCGWDTGLPAWGLVIALAIAFINFVPQGLLECITNQHVGLNIITELVCGYILPFRPMANLLFKLYGFIVMRQGLELSRDLKMGLYLKIAPRLLFFMQIYSTLWSGLVNVGIQRWMRFNIENICSTSQENGFTCASGRTVFNASIIWSLPKFLFSPGQRYNCFMWFFLIGLICPFITYALHKRWPNKWYGKINAPVFFTGPGNIPPATPYNYSCFAVLGSVIYYIRRRWPRWHARYNFVLGAGVESGVAIAVVIIFLCVQFPMGSKHKSFNWWGNDVYKNTIDWKGSTFYKLETGETFGPDKWW